MTTSIINANTVKPARAGGKKGQWKIAAIAIAVCVGVGAVAYPKLVPTASQTTISDYSLATVMLQDLSRTAQASGTVQLPNQMVVPAPNEGYSAELLVSVGDMVEKNQIIALIEVPDLDETIEDLQANLTSSKISLQRTILSYENSLEDSAANIKTLQSDIADLQQEVEKYEALVNISAASKSDLETVQDQLEDAENQLADAQRSVKQNTAIHQLDLASAQASIEQTQTQLDRALSEKESAKIKSPMAGEVLEIADVMNVPGSSVEQGTELFTIADPSSAVFDLEISEEYANDIALGDQVPVTVGSSTLTGEITFIGKVAQTSSDGLGASVQVKVKPVQTTNELLLGSTAIGQFTLGVEEDALTLPRGSYLTTGSQKYIYVVDGNQAIKTSVTYGEIEGNTVQVTSGLIAGDQVITSGYQNFISESTVTLGE